MSIVPSTKHKTTGGLLALVLLIATAAGCAREPLRSADMVAVNDLAAAPDRPQDAGVKDGPAGKDGPCDVEGVCECLKNSDCNPPGAPDSKICVDKKCVIGCDNDVKCVVKGQDQGLTCCARACVPGVCCDNSQCADGKVCSQHMCSPCTDNGMCGMGALCCPGANNEKSCVAGTCCSTANCAGGETCVQNGCYEVCVNDKCKMPNARCCGTACIPDSNCCTNKDCQMGMAGMACLAKKVNGVLNYNCAPCTEDAQCDAGFICTAGTCVPGCSDKPNKGCGMNGVCCDAMNVQCKGGGPACQGQCIPGACCTNLDCNPNEVCDPDHICRTQCKQEKDCDFANTQRHCCAQRCEVGVCATTIAGSGMAGAGDDSKANALLSGHVLGVAVRDNNSEQVYFSGDYGIRMLDNVKKTVTRVAGMYYGCKPGPAAKSEMMAIQGIAFAGNGKLYAADSGCNVIWEYDPKTEMVSVLAGDSTSGFWQAGDANDTGDKARFNGPTGLTVFNGSTIFVTDIKGHTVRKVTLAGEVSTIAGDGMPGQVEGVYGMNPAPRFANPSAIAADPAGNLYVGENHATGARIYKLINGAKPGAKAEVKFIFDSKTGLPMAMRVYPGTFGVGPGGKLLLSSYDRSGLYELAPEPNPNQAVYTPKSLSAGASAGLGLDPAGATMWVGGFSSGNGNNSNTLSQRDLAGVVIPPIVGVPNVEGVEDGPTLEAAINTSCAGGLTVDKAGNIWHADRCQNRIRRVDAKTGMVTSYGSGRPGVKGGAAADAEFRSPTAPVAVGSDIYFITYWNGYLFKIDGAADPKDVNAVKVLPRLTLGADPNDVWYPSLPGGMVADKAGNLYLSVYAQYVAAKVVTKTQALIVKIPSWGTGKATIFAGTLDVIGCQGPTMLGRPSYLALDASDTLVVADTRCGVHSIDGNGRVSQELNLNPTGVALGPVENGTQTIYVASGHLIYTMNKGDLTKFQWLAGVPPTIAEHFRDGKPGDARFWGPVSLAMTADGHLRIADTLNFRIRNLFLH